MAVYAVFAVFSAIAPAAAAGLADASSESSLTEQQRTSTHFPTTGRNFGGTNVERKLVACGLCPDSLQDRTLVASENDWVEFGALESTIINCQTVAGLVELISDSESQDCQQAQNAFGFLCCNPNKGEYDLCAGGAVPPEPITGVIPFRLNYGLGIGVPSTPSGGTKCADVMLRSALSFFGGNPFFFQLQYIYALYCGCPDFPELTCEICEDGGRVDFPEKLQAIPYPGPTCAEQEAKYALVLDETEPEGRSLHESPGRFIFLQLERELVSYPTSCVCSATTFCNFLDPGVGIGATCRPCLHVGVPMECDLFNIPLLGADDCHRKCFGIEMNPNDCAEGQFWNGNSCQTCNGADDRRCTYDKNFNIGGENCALSQVYSKAKCCEGIPACSVCPNGFKNAEVVIEFGFGFLAAFSGLRNTTCQLASEWVTNFPEDDAICGQYKQLVAELGCQCSSGGGSNPDTFSKPSSQPSTVFPSKTPSAAPSQQPTTTVSFKPSLWPSASAPPSSSSIPTALPSYHPTYPPFPQPLSRPSLVPTESFAPSSAPSGAPSPGAVVLDSMPEPSNSVGPPLRAATTVLLEVSVAMLFLVLHLLR